MKSEQLRDLLNEHSFFEEMVSRRPKRGNKFSLLLTLLAFSTPLTAGTYAVTSSEDTGAGTFRNSISLAGQDSKPTILLPSGSTIKLQGVIPVVIPPNSTITISGSATNRPVLDGQGLSRAFAIDPATSPNSTLVLENLVLQNFAATGSRGGNASASGGGGGASPGLGGFQYIAPGQTVSSINTVIQSHTATGGHGGNTVVATPIGGGGGGAGPSGRGGDSTTTDVGGGGGGGGTPTSVSAFNGGDAVSASGSGGGASDIAVGSNSSGTNGGNGGLGTFGVAGAGGNSITPNGGAGTGTSGGGGGGKSGVNTGAGGSTSPLPAAPNQVGGGGGGACTTVGGSTIQPDGGETILGTIYAGGGGGGGTNATATLIGIGGSAGAFAGGGGGGANGPGGAGGPGTGGIGGFGGGGGGQGRLAIGGVTNNASGGYAGGQGGGGTTTNPGGGGGGGAMGGAFFVDGGLGVGGATLNLTDSAFLANSVVGGIGGTSPGQDGFVGTGYGNDVFVTTGGTVNVNYNLVNTLTMHLDGDPNIRSGGLASPTSGGIFATIISALPSATLQLTNSTANYLCPLNIGDNITLQITADGALGNATNTLNLGNNAIISLGGSSTTFGSGRVWSLSGQTTLFQGTNVTVNSLLQDGTSPGSLVIDQTSYTFTNTNTYTGGTTLTSGTVNISSDANLGAVTSAVNFNGLAVGSASLVFLPATFTSIRPYNFIQNGTITPGATSLTLTGPLTGSGTFKLGTGGDFIITANAGTTLSGTALLSNENIFLSGTNPLGTATLQTNSVNNNVTLTGTTLLPNPVDLVDPLQLNATAGASQITGAITGSGDLTYSGTDPATLLIAPTTNNTGYTGVFTQQQGTLSVSGTNPLGTTLFDFNAGTLNFIGTNTSMGIDTNLSPSVVLNATAGSFTTFTGAINGGLTPAATFNGPGTILFENPNSTVIGTFDLNNSITLQVTANNPPNVGNGILGVVDLDFKGPATLEFLTPGGSYTGTLINKLTFDGAGGVLVADTNTTTTISGQITGTAGYTVGRTTDNQTGILILSNNNNTVNGPIQLNAGTLSVQGPTYLSNPVSGTPSPIIFNGGILQLTGTNTVTPFLDNIVVDPSRTASPWGGTLLLNSGTTNDWNGTITGSPLLITGGGTLALGQTGNTATMYVDASTLAAASSAFLGTGDIHLQNQAVLDLTALTSNAYSNNLFMDTGGGVIETSGSTQSLNGIIGGVGSLTYTGPGTLALNNSNTYQGGTLINGSLIQICGNNPLGAGVVQYNGGNLEVTCNSTLSNAQVFNTTPTITIDSGISGTFIGNLSGPGGFTKLGNGTLTLMGNSSYLGTTTITAGLVRVAGTNPFGLGPLILGGGGIDFIGNTTIGNVSFALTAPSTLTADPGVTAIINPAISGGTGASVTKMGAGTVIFNGNNTYAGATLVAQGTLQVNGILSTSTITTQVNAGATLTGTGTTNALDVFGTLAPGNPTGTLTTGNVTFETGSRFMPTVIGTTVGAVQANGSVTIAGGTSITPVLQNVPPGSYTVINATGPVSGVFTSISSADQSARFPLTVSYTPHTVVLNFSQVPFSELFPRGNLQNIGFCFDQLVASSTAPDLLADLNVLNSLTQTQLNSAFNQLDPSLYNVLALAEQYTAETTRWIFSRHAYDRQFDPKFLGGLWTDLFAGRVDQENAGGGQALSGYKDTIYGAVAGFDSWIASAVLSAGGSYTRSQIRWSEANTALASMNSYTGFIGLTTFSNPAMFDLYGSYTYNDVTGSRDIYITPSPSLVVAFPPSPPINKHIRYQNQSSVFTGHMGLLSTIPIPNSSLFTLAFGNFDYLYVSQHPFTETGAGSLNLNIHAQTSDVLLPEIGTGLGYYTSFAGEGNLLVDFRISFVKEFRFSGKNLNSNFVGNGCVFSVDGLFQNNGLICPSLHILINGVSGVDLSFDVRGAYWGRYAETTGKMEFIYVF